jgi:ATP-dependent 26S proteasome regulatory subunit
LDEGCLDECIVFSDMVDAVAAARARFEASWRAELADTLEEEMAYA